ncbi:MAG: FG-GAP-like repeat-containing protein [Deltaproteobacteria bacterium]|nr:FG-GAP-like repeat-containing protein [Deltaproteobacteria bacterium]
MRRRQRNLQRGSILQPTFQRLGLRGVRLLPLAILAFSMASAAQAQLDTANFRILSGLSGDSGDHVGSALAVGDFDGDGLDDLAIGVPGASGSNGGEVGRLVYYLGAASGFGTNGSFSPAFLGLDIEAGARFGAALAAGDFNGDGFDDLAIGIPGRVVAGDDNAGQVVILYADGLNNGGSPWDVSDPALFSQANLAGQVEAGDSFGMSLAAGDLNQDGLDDLAVGVPLEDIFASGFGIRVDAGAVNVIYSVDGVGLTTADNEVLHLEVDNVSQNAGHDDLFGFSLAIADFTGDLQPDLAVGVPGDFIGAADGSGSVEIFETDGNGINVLADEQLFNQADPDIQGTPSENDSFGFSLAVGDFDGNGRADLAVGVPGDEEFKTFADEGAIQIFYGRINGLSTLNDQFFTAEAGGGPYFPAAFNRWGEALATGDFDSNGLDDLAVGAPLSNWEGVPNSGQVNVFYGLSTQFGLQVVGIQHFNMSLFGSLAAGDEFGFALATGNFANSNGGAGLIVGVPNLEAFGDPERGSAVFIRSGFPFLDGFETGDTSRWSAVVP